VTADSFPLINSYCTSRVGESRGDVPKAPRDNLEPTDLTRGTRGTLAGPLRVALGPRTHPAARIHVIGGALRAPRDSFNCRRRAIPPRNYLSRYRPGPVVGARIARLCHSNPGPGILPDTIVPFRRRYRTAILFSFLPPFSLYELRVDRLVRKR